MVGLKTWRVVVTPVARPPRGDRGGADPPLWAVEPEIRRREGREIAHRIEAEEGAEAAARDFPSRTGASSLSPRLPALDPVVRWIPLSRSRRARSGWSAIRLISCR
jgi:hypothetical protein